MRTKQLPLHEGLKLILNYQIRFCPHGTIFPDPTAIRSKDIRTAIIIFNYTQGRFLSRLIDTLLKECLKKLFILIRHYFRELLFGQLNLHITQSIHYPFDTFRMGGEMFDDQFQEIYVLLTQYFQILLQFLLLLLQLLFLILQFIILILNFIKPLLCNFLLLIDCSLSRIKSLPSLQLKTKIQFLIKFDPGHHSISHLLVLLIYIFYHHILTLLLLKSI